MLEGGARARLEFLDLKRNQLGGAAGEALSSALRRGRKEGLALSRLELMYNPMLKDEDVTAQVEAAADYVGVDVDFDDNLDEPTYPLFHF